MIWLLYSSLRTLSISAVFSTYEWFGKRLGWLLFFCILFSCCSLVLLVIVLTAGTFPKLSFSLILSFLIATPLIVSGNLFSIAAFSSHDRPGDVTTVSTLSVPLVILISAYLEGTRVTGIQWIGVFAFLSGTFLITRTKP